SNSLTSRLLKKLLKVAPQRNLPTLQKQSLRSWYMRFTKLSKFSKPNPPISKVYLFCDEFTNYNDTHIGIKTIELLTKLGYEVKLIDHPESGRAAISKGLLDRAQNYAQRNIDIFKNIITEDTPLVGIEPSAILSFRDEYPRLVKKTDVAAANDLAKNCFTIEEFIHREFENGNIKSEQFTTAPKRLLVHGHCHQKALSSVDFTAWMLAIPTNYEVEIIPSGCCGMAGSFGYEAEHYEVSQQIGELVLFPAVRQAEKDVTVVAAGTSCRHQIQNGVGKGAVHPVEVMWAALEHNHS
ncbi:MAG: (Fe-S)-binding protein, partial [Saprospiraceae bacterium]